MALNPEPRVYLMPLSMRYTTKWQLPIDNQVGVRGVEPLLLCCCYLPIGPEGEWASGLSLPIAHHWQSCAGLSLENRTQQQCCASKILHSSLLSTPLLCSWALKGVTRMPLDGITLRHRLLSAFALRLPGNGVIGKRSFFFFFQNIYLFIICRYTAAVFRQTHQSDLLKHGCEPQCGCWDLNSGPSEEQSGTRWAISPAPFFFFF